MKKNKLHKTLLSISIFILGIMIIIKLVMPTHYYLCTAGMGPICVDDEIQDGYKVIGRYKLWNPHPRTISKDDFLFIKGQLPKWLKEKHYESSIIKASERLSIDDIKRHTKYSFTILSYSNILEGDIYVLTWYFENKSINIYLAKATVSDEQLLKKDGTLAGKEVLVYPFFDEEWHSNIDSKELYSPGDLW